MKKIFFQNANTNLEVYRITETTIYEITDKEKYQKYKEDITIKMMEFDKAGYDGYNPHLSILNLLSSLKVYVVLKSPYSEPIRNKEEKNKYLEEKEKLFSQNILKVKEIYYQLEIYYSSHRFGDSEKYTILNKFKNLEEMNKFYSEKIASRLISDVIEIEELM